MKILIMKIQAKSPQFDTGLDFCSFVSIGMGSNLKMFQCVVWVPSLSILLWWQCQIRNLPEIQKNDFWNANVGRNTKEWKWLLAGVLREQNLEVLITLFQPQGADHVHHITACTPGFENLTITFDHPSLLSPGLIWWISVPVKIITKIINIDIITIDNNAETDENDDYENIEKSRGSTSLRPVNVKRNWIGIEMPMAFRMKDYQLELNPSVLEGFCPMRCFGTSRRSRR